MFFLKNWSKGFKILKFENLRFEFKISISPKNILKSKVALKVAKVAKMAICARQLHLVFQIKPKQPVDVTVSTNLRHFCSNFFSQFSSFCQFLSKNFEFPWKMILLKMSIFELWPNLKAKILKFCQNLTVTKANFWIFAKFDVRNFEFQSKLHFLNRQFLIFWPFLG